MKITRSDLALEMARYRDKTEEKESFVINMYERLDLLYVVISEIEKDKDFHPVGAMLRTAIEECTVKQIER
jgi:hypothetical protein